LYNISAIIFSKSSAVTFIFFNKNHASAGFTRGRKKEQVQKKRIIDSEKESERVSAIQSKKK